MCSSICDLKNKMATPEASGHLDQNCHHFTIYTMNESSVFTEMFKKDNISYNLM